MRQIFLLFLGFSLFHHPSPLSGQTSDAELHATLEKVYLRWREAMIRKDAQAWAATITRYRQTVIRNLVVSERRKFPDAVFASEVQPPALAGLRLLEVQEVGLTAHLVYFGKINMGQDQELVRDNILKLKFYRENGEWKYDSNRITRLENAPEVLKELQAGKRPDFLDLPEYTPPGSMPPPPPLCRVPDHKAGYKLQTLGYETTISMNGIDYEPVQDALDQQVLIGGLVNRHNEITLKIKPVPVPEGSKASLQFRVYILANDPDKPGTEVLRWQAPETGAPAQVTLPFEVKP
ncbi:hypothetical protein [Prosthecobacter sp.]|uniref:hypothetical protein n=1 Tax=Prosthecobacter sp. TaxID=1965333 RepID=UPI002ABC0E35|nr:hypothetical protein [Prosthecobacter sp.]MDZ4404775.1 hypothetical protein [Prosthecobacter sp.]